MTSLAASGRLQNVIKYCITVRKTCPASKESNKLATVWCKITSNTRIVCRDFSSLVAWRFAWPLQLVDFLLSFGEICSFTLVLCTGVFFDTLLMLPLSDSTASDDLQPIGMSVRFSYWIFKTCLLFISFWYCINCHSCGLLDLRNCSGRIGSKRIWVVWIWKQVHWWVA